MKVSPFRQLSYYPMRIMKLLGCTHTIITNAAGGLNPDWDVGTVVAVLDHMSLPSLPTTLTFARKRSAHPRSSTGPRGPFAKVSTLGSVLDHVLSPFPSPLRAQTDALDIETQVAGPSYETRAEQRFLRAAGADAVGMSTVPEVIAARHAGLRVLVLSLITNIVVATPYRYAEAVVETEESSTLDGLSKVTDARETQEEEEGVANHQEVSLGARRCGLSLSFYAPPSAVPGGRCLRETADYLYCSPSFLEGSRRFRKKGGRYSLLGRAHSRAMLRVEL
ncbi:SPOSA6832_04681, partial [Sporobolomyces salmonicolor]